MENKLAKLKFLPNNFEIIEEGDHVLCSISGKVVAFTSLTNSLKAFVATSATFPKRFANFGLNVLNPPIKS